MRRGGCGKGGCNLGLIDRLDRFQTDQCTKESGTSMARIQKLILDRHAFMVLEARTSQVKRDQLRGLVLQYVVTEGLSVPGMSREEVAESILQEMIGYGPIDSLLRDPSVTEIMVNGPSRVYVERGGKLEKTSLCFRDSSHVEEVIGKIMSSIGRRIDRASPLADGRLPDGSRVNAIIPPLALDGPVLTIRKFSSKAITAQQLVENGTCTQEAMDFLRRCVKGKMNILISGGTSSGKTTTLNALSEFIGEGERVITLEDCAELRLACEHVVALETCPPNIEGKGEVTLRQLLKNALRMRPDRIIIGECRGAEAFELLQALNTGHEGSLSTVHANSAMDALFRLENMVLMAGEMLPHFAVRAQVAAAIQVIVHQARLLDGRRVIDEVCVLDGYDVAEGRFRLRQVFWRENGELRHHQSCTLPERVFQKLAAAAGELPSWLQKG